MSSVDYRSLPPLPDSLIISYKPFPSASTSTAHYNVALDTKSSHHDPIEHNHVYSNPSPQRQRQRSLHKSDHGQHARVPSSDDYRSTPFLLRSPSKHRSQSHMPTILPCVSVSPAKIPLPASPVRPSAQLLSPAGMGGLDESCIFPQTAGPGQNLSFSLIGDTSMPDMLSMEFDDSLEFGSRPPKARGMPIKTRPAAYKAVDDASISQTATSAAKISRDHTATTPARTSRKAERTPAPSTSSRSSPRKEHSTSVSPSRQVTSSRPARSPAKAPTAASRTKRTFPASSSNNMLSRLGEGEEGNIETGDISSLLPMSPVGMGHLMSDEHQLMRQSLPMSEGPSFLLPAPPASSRKTPRAQVQRSPVKDADMTFDVNQLMARMPKPKRPSGTEESFVDLLHDSDLDLYAMDGDETFLPADLRTRSKPFSSHVRGTSASVKAIDLPPVVSRTPVKPTAIETDYQGMQRIGVASARQHMTPGRFTTEHEATSRPRRPGLSASRLMTPGRSAAESGDPRPQATRAAPTPKRLAQAPVSNRGPSPSVGAIALPTSASYTKMELPKPTTAKHERSRSTVNTAEILNQTLPSGLVRPRSERDLTTRLGGPANPKAATTIAAPTSRSTASAMPREATSRPGSTRTGVSALSALGAPSRSVLPKAQPAALPSAISAIRPASFRPTSILGASKSSLPPAPGRSMAPPTQTARPGLSRPPATTSSRTFGADGAGQTNRLLIRPSASVRPANINAGKMSLMPSTSPSKRATTSTIKSRAASTPAETVARTMTRPSTRPVPSGLPSSSASKATTSGLPRPGTSRLPTTTKLSAGPGSTSANLAALRAKIDAATARHTMSRKA